MTREILLLFFYSIRTAVFVEEIIAVCHQTHQSEREELVAVGCISLISSYLPYFPTRPSKQMLLRFVLYCEILGKSGRREDEI